MTHVVIVTESIDGGAGNAVRRAAAAITESGDQPLKITFVTRAFLLNTQSSRNLRFLAGPIINWLLRQLHRFYWTIGGSSVHTFASISLGADQQINKLSPDIVVLNWIGNQTISLKEIRNINAPIMLRLPDTWALGGTAHFVPTDSWSRLLDQFIFGAFQRWHIGQKVEAWREIHAVIAPSNWLTNLAIDSKLFPRAKFYTIPNTLSLPAVEERNRLDSRSLFGSEEEDFVIGFVSAGALTDPRKGLKTLLDSLELLQKIPGIIFPSRPLRVLAAGSVTESERARLLSQHNITPVGKLDESGLSDLYSACDLVVVPSSIDNFPQVALEAMAWSNCVIGSRQGGLKEMIRTGNSGLLFESTDHVALAGRIAQVYGNRNFRESLAKSARKAVETVFSYDKVGALWRSAIHETVSFKSLENRKPKESSEED